MKHVAILQSSYIPWKGYFDIINSVDEFVLYDDVQYTHRDWRNRNRIKTASGLLWLTIPVTVKKHCHDKICDVKVANKSWANKQWKTVSMNYARAPYFKPLKNRFQALYTRCSEETCLSRINYLFLKEICRMLDIHTRISWSMDYEIEGERSERLLHLCLLLNADVYLSGPAAKEYLDVKLFEENGVRVRWMSYDGYPEYSQLHGGPFIHHVSILDLIFNTGPDNARKHMLSFSNMQSPDNHKSKV